MPELPEVETVIRILKTQILGLQINEVNVYYDGVLENVSETNFKLELVGETFRDIKRKGKFLIFLLDKHTLVVHLRMEGKFFLKNDTYPVVKHEHLLFKLSNNTDLRYHDTRKFGKFVLLNTTSLEEVMKYPSLAKLGPDAIDITSYDEVEKAILNYKGNVKGMLLDQTIMAGIGNIYADEICFMSKLHPLEKCSNLSRVDVENIVDNAKIVLNKAISLGGTTIRSYTSSLGVTGRFQNELLVHEKLGEACPVCGDKLIKIRVDGRGTTYCRCCQRRRDYIEVIGITGLIAAGKTMVTSYLMDKGYPVIDCDEINRDIMKPDHEVFPEVFEKISKVFPSACENGEINRKALRQIIFNNKDYRKELQNIIYPIIKKIIIKLIKTEKNDIILYTKPKVIFLSAPLLLESGFDELCDDVIIVKAEKEEQIRRIISRDHASIEEAIEAIAIRKSFEELYKEFLTHDLYPRVIDNSGTLTDLYKQVDKTLSIMMEA